MRIGALTMVRAGGTVRKAAAPKVLKPVARLTVQPRAVSDALAPRTPNVPGFAPGTIMQLDSRAGAGQVAERTYEQVAPAPVTTGAAQVTTADAPEKSSPFLPLAALAAFFLMG